MTTVNSTNEFARVSSKIPDKIRYFAKFSLINTYKICYGFAIAREKVGIFSAIR
jgi:hypothetical protein